jgi:hypothetical protein
MAIDAVNGHGVWSLAHIGEEVFKFVPAFANLNAFGSVAIKAFVSGIVAAHEHATPSVIGRCSGHAVRGNRSQLLSAPKTAARRGWVLCFQSIAAYFRQVSAVALTYPTKVLAWCFGATQDNKASVALTDQLGWQHSHIMLSERR